MNEITRRCSGGKAPVESPAGPPADPAADPPADPPADPRPYYQRHVFCCINERPCGHPRGCCKERGAVRLRNYMKARAKELALAEVRINAAGCLDRCELGPTMVIYPEGVWYSYHTPEDVDEILRVHLGEGGRVTRLLLQPEDAAPSTGPNIVSNAK